MEFGPASRGRMWISLGILVVLATMSGLTMEASRFRTLSWVLLGFFAVRILLARAGSR